ncbi:MAG: DUF3276 family protein [Rectinemataceae bacterium]
MMGIRGELFSTKMTCDGRTYFFNVKQNRMGDVFLSIVESKPTEAESFDRRSIVVFREDMKGFLKAFQTTLGYMEKNGSTPPTMRFDPADGAPPPARFRAQAALEGDEAFPSVAAGKPETKGEKKRKVVVRKKPVDSEGAKD